MTVLPPPSVAYRADAREMFRAVPAPVVAVCATIDGTPVGMAASSFSGVSETPTLISLAIRSDSRTWVVLRDRPRLGISLMGVGQRAAIERLASREGDRFAGLGTVEGAEGALLVCGAAAWIQCRVVGEVPAGDHLIALLEADDLRLFRGVEPLVYHGRGYRRLTEED